MGSDRNFIKNLPSVEKHRTNAQWSETLSSDHLVDGSFLSTCLRDDLLPQQILCDSELGSFFYCFGLGRVLDKYLLSDSRPLIVSRVVY